MSFETEAIKLLKEIRTDVKAIRRQVDPDFGAEPPQTVRKKDPRALYRDS